MDLKDLLKETNDFLTGTSYDLEDIKYWVYYLNSFDLSSLSEDEKESLESILSVTTNTAILLRETRNLLSEQGEKIMKKDKEI